MRALWRAAVQVAAMAGAGALVVFLVFPRWGMGVFLRGQAGPRRPERVLQHVSARHLRTDQERRHRRGPDGPDDSPAGPDRAGRATHLAPAGQRASNIYENGHWSHGLRVENVPLLGVGRFVVLGPDGRPPVELRHTGVGRDAVDYVARPVPGFAASRETMRVRMTLEDLGVDVLFAASEPLGVQRAAPRGSIE